MNKVKIAMIPLVVTAITLAGCATKMGDVKPNTRFAFPNSNVRILAPTHGEFSDWSIILPPRPPVDKYRDTYNSAVAEVEGANMLVNMKEDTTLVMVPIPFIPLYFVKYEIDADAAQMVIGKQELK